VYANNLTYSCPMLKWLYGEVRSWPHFAVDLSEVNATKKTDNDKHRRINEPSKSSVVSSSIIKTTLDIVTQGYAEFLGGFKGVIEIDGDRCG